MRYTKKDIELQLLTKSDQDDGIPFSILAVNYAEYVKELKRYSDYIEEDILLLPEENPDTCYVIIWLHTLTDRVFAGFYFYGSYPNSFARQDMYIGEFYVRPEYRNSGVATAVFDMIIASAEEQDKDISYFCLTQNYRAQKLWNRILSSYDYEERFAIGDICAITTYNPDCQMYYWIKTKE